MGTIVQMSSSDLHAGHSDHGDRTYEVGACVGCGFTTSEMFLGANGKVYFKCGGCISKNRHGDRYGRGTIGPRSESGHNA